MCLEDECDSGRRAFVKGAAGAVVGLASADVILSQANQYKDVPTRVLDEPSVTHGPVMFQHQKRDIIGGYLARPKAEGKYPAVVVLPGNIISEEYIPNTCAALALAGFVGLAPNIFHPPIGTPQRLDTPREDQAGHSDSDAIVDTFIALDYLRRQTFVRMEGEFPFVRFDGLGVVGFCYGGRLAMLLGARSADIDAVVAYHPGPFQPQEMKRLRGPVLVHQGTADRGIPEGQTAALVKNLKAAKIPTTDYWYEGADHGFLAYTRPTYKADAGKLSWDRTIAFLKKNLRA